MTSWCRCSAIAAGELSKVSDKSLLESKWNVLLTRALSIRFRVEWVSDYWTLPQTLFPRLLSALLEFSMVISQPISFLQLNRFLIHDPWPKLSWKGNLALEFTPDCFLCTVKPLQCRQLSILDSGHYLSDPRMVENFFKVDKHSLKPLIFAIFPTPSLEIPEKLIQIDKSLLIHHSDHFQDVLLPREIADFQCNVIDIRLL